MACLGTGTTSPPCRTCRLHPRGKCRDFPRFRCTFPRSLSGHRLHKPLSPHLPFPPPGKSAGISCDSGALSPVACLGTGTTSPSRRTCRLHPRGKVPGFPAILVHFPPWHEASGEVQQGMLWEVPSIQAFLKRASAGPGVKWRFCGKMRAVQQIARLYTPNNQCNTFG